LEPIASAVSGDEAAALRADCARRLFRILIVGHLFMVVLYGPVGVFGLLSLRRHAIALPFVFAGIGGATGALACAVAATVARTALAGHQRHRRLWLAAGLSTSGVVMVAISACAALISGVLVALQDTDLVADMALTVGAVVSLGLLGTNVHTLVRTIRRIRSVSAP
jgi:hypothetical protein